MHAKPLNRKEIIKTYNFFLNNFKLKPSQVTLGPKGSAVMHGKVKNIPELDLEVTPLLFEQLRRTVSTQIRVTELRNKEVTAINYANVCEIRTDKIPTVTTAVVDGVHVYAVI